MNKPLVPQEDESSFADLGHEAMNIANVEETGEKPIEAAQGASAAPEKSRVENSPYAQFDQFLSQGSLEGDRGQEAYDTLFKMSPQERSSCLSSLSPEASNSLTDWIAERGSEDLAGNGVLEMLDFKCPPNGDPEKFTAAGKELLKNFKVGQRIEVAEKLAAMAGADSDPSLRDDLVHIAKDFAVTASTMAGSGRWEMIGAQKTINFMDRFHFSDAEGAQVAEGVPRNYESARNRLMQRYVWKERSASV
ncbi:MAG: hypothetical protein ACREGR_03655 [Minisyncoccia bacterium]